MPDGGVRLNGVHPPPPEGFMAIDNVFDAVLAGEPLSVTVTVNEYVPAAVGVPDITPVVPFKLKPVGKLPEVTAHVYDGLPPVALNVVLGYDWLTVP